MTGFYFRKLVQTTGKIVPKTLRLHLKESPAIKRMIDAISGLDEPKKVKLSDGTEWTRIDSCPKSLLDPGGAQIGNRMYVICGFENQATVSDKVYVFDMDRQKWTGEIKIPYNLPHSHSAVATDGERFIYIAGGQLGPYCRPAVSTAYCLDTVNHTWHPLPPLPAPRYAGTMQLWRGKLHYVGGADVDRWTPMSDHWSLRISGTVATDGKWVQEPPIPVPGMHRSSAVVNDKLFVMGGQQGDFKAIVNDPNYACTGRTQETYLNSVFRLDFPESEWKRMADMPIAVSHCDFSCLSIKDQIFFYGGQIYKHPEKFYLRLTDAIQAYDTQADQWSIAGYLPHHLKMPVLGFHEEKIFITVGQRGSGTSDRPGAITSKTWVSPAPTPRQKITNRIAATSGKRVLLISHELTRSGAPLELLELGEAMMESGADVRFVTLKGDMDCGNVAADFKIAVIPPETAMSAAVDADLIVVNTSHELVRAWVVDALALAPRLASRILWLVHEIDIEDFGPCAPALHCVHRVVFDSAACRNAWHEIGGAPDTSRVIHPGLPDRIFSSAQQPKHLFVEGSERPLSKPPRLLTRNEIRSALHLHDDDIVILSVGTVHPPKGQRMLLRSLAKAASERKLPLKLILAGFGSAVKKQAFIEQLDANERQVFNNRLGYAVTPHIDALYAASDIHVLNSQGRHGRGETFGRATVHALVFGLPALGTNAGGTPEIIEDGVQGYVYPVGEAGQDVLMNRLEDLVLNSSLPKKNGEAARERAGLYFSKNVYLERINTVINGIITDSTNEARRSSVI